MLRRNVFSFLQPTGGVQIVRTRRPASILSTQTHSWITRLTLGLTEDSLRWLLRQRKTHPEVTVYAVDLVGTSSVAPFLIGHVAQPVRIVYTMDDRMACMHEHKTLPGLI